MSPGNLDFLRLYTTKEAYLIQRGDAANDSSCLVVLRSEQRMYPMSVHDGRSMLGLTAVSLSEAIQAVLGRLEIEGESYLFVVADASHAATLTSYDQNDYPVMRVDRVRALPLSAAATATGAAGEGQEQAQIYLERARQQDEEERAPKARQEEERAALKRRLEEAEREKVESRRQQVEDLTKTRELYIQMTKDYPSSRSGRCGQERIKFVNEKMINPIPSMVLRLFNPTPTTADFYCCKDRDITHSTQRYGASGGACSGSPALCLLLPRVGAPVVAGPLAADATRTSGASVPGQGGGSAGGRRAHALLQQGTRREGAQAGRRRVRTARGAARTLARQRLRRLLQEGPRGEQAAGAIRSSGAGALGCGAPLAAARAADHGASARAAAGAAERCGPAADCSLPAGGRLLAPQRTAEVSVGVLVIFGGVFSLRRAVDGRLALRLPLSGGGVCEKSTGQVRQGSGTEGLDFAHLNPNFSLENPSLLSSISLAFQQPNCS